MNYNCVGWHLVKFVSGGVEKLVKIMLDEKLEAIIRTEVKMFFFRPIFSAQFLIESFFNYQSNPFNQILFLSHQINSKLPNTSLAA